MKKKYLNLIFFNLQRDHRLLYSWLVFYVISISIALLTFVTFHWQFRITFLLIPAINIYFLICINEQYKILKKEKESKNLKTNPAIFVIEQETTLTAEEINKMSGNGLIQSV